MTHPLWLALNNHRGRLLLAIMITVLTALAGLGLLTLSGWFIAAAGLAGAAGPAAAAAFNLFQPSSGVRFFALARTLGRYIDRLVSHDVTFRLIADLRRTVFVALTPLAPGRLAGWRSGDLLSRITADVDALEAVTLRVIMPFAGTAGVVLAAFILFAWLDGVIAMVMLIGCGITGGLLPWWQGRRTEHYGRDVPTRAAELRSVLLDNIDGLLELISAGAVDRQRARVAEASRHALDLGDQLQRLEAQASFAAGIVTHATFLSVLWLALNHVVAGQLDGTAAALLCFGTLAVFEPVAGLAAAWQHMGRALASAERISEITALPPTVPAAASPFPLPERYHLSLEKVGYRYDGRGEPAIRDLCLTIAEGEKLAVLGESGAGKSTLAALLLRLQDPQEGRLTLGGTDLRDLSQADLWRSIAYLPQRPDLFDGSLAENLRLAAPQAPESALMSALAAVGLDTLARQRQGLDTQIGPAGSLLSGGQARRLALARLLLTDAHIWLLDEATEGVDGATEQLLLDTILAQTERTVIFITHRHTGLERFHRIAVMAAGGLRILQ